VLSLHRYIRVKVIVADGDVSTGRRLRALQPRNVGRRIELSGCIEAASGARTPPAWWPPRRARRTRSASSRRATLSAAVRLVPTPPRPGVGSRSGTV